MNLMNATSHESAYESDADYDEDSGNERYSVKGQDSQLIISKFESDFEERHVNFLKECLESHNLYRVIHFTHPLELDRKLCAEARIWARYLTELGRLENRYKCPFGENIFFVWPTKTNYTVRGGEPVEHWYAGIRDYTFGSDAGNLLCLNFTQLVWRDTKRLGVGIARGMDGKIFVVAYYDPIGNVMGEFSDQVPPAGGYPEWGLEALSGGNLAEAEAAKGFSSTQSECLQLHNQVRRRHGVPLLALSKPLCKEATTWARHLADNDLHGYRVDNPLGENVYSSSAGDLKMRQRGGIRTAIETWYREIRFFEFGQEPFDTKARNFTQMVWRSTRWMGVGVARGRGGRVLIVCEYYPRGNVVGLYRDNVPPRVRPVWQSTPGSASQRPHSADAAFSRNLTQ